MNSRTTLYMAITVIVGFAIILMMNVMPLLGISQAKYLSPGEVRGMAVQHKKLLYTLNFEQQNACLEIFNRSTPASHSEVEARKTTSAKIAEVTKIIIYRFNAPDIEIEPVALVAKTTSVTGSNPPRYNLVFSAPEWNPNGLLVEATQDQLLDLLAKTYDH